MIIYEELKKRNLVENIKEYSEMIWMKQIKVNGENLNNPLENYNKNKIKTIKIGILEFEL